MATKSHHFTELGERTCAKCGKKLKRRIQESKPTANRCYSCYIIDENKRRNNR